MAAPAARPYAESRTMRAQHNHHRVVPLLTQRWIEPTENGNSVTPHLGEDRSGRFPALGTWQRSYMLPTRRVRGRVPGTHSVSTQSRAEIVLDSSYVVWLFCLAFFFFFFNLENSGRLFSLRLTKWTTCTWTHKYQCTSLVNVSI